MGGLIHIKNSKVDIKCDYVLTASTQWRKRYSLKNGDSFVGGLVLEDYPNADWMLGDKGPKGLLFLTDAEKGTDAISIKPEDCKFIEKADASDFGIINAIKNLFRSS